MRFRGDTPEDYPIRGIADENILAGQMTAQDNKGLVRVWREDARSLGGPAGEDDILVGLDPGGSEDHGHRASLELLENQWVLYALAFSWGICVGFLIALLFWDSP